MNFESSCPLAIKTIWHNLVQIRNGTWIPQYQNCTVVRIHLMTIDTKKRQKSLPAVSLPIGSPPECHAVRWNAKRPNKVCWSVPRISSHAWATVVYPPVSCGAWEAQSIGLWLTFCRPLGINLRPRFSAWQIWMLWESRTIRKWLTRHSSPSFLFLLRSKSEACEIAVHRVKLKCLACNCTMCRIRACTCRAWKLTVGR